MANTFTFFELHAPDLAKAKSFYGEMFNWKFKDMEVPGPKFALSETQGHQGGIAQDPKPSWLNYITVPDCAEAAAKAKRLGGRILGEKQEVPGRGWFVVVADPFGSAIALWQEMKES